MRESSAQQETTGQDILQRYGRMITSPASSAPASQLWSAEARQAIEQGQLWEETLYARKLARQAEKFADARQRWHYLDLHLRLPDALVGPTYQLATAEHMALRSPYLIPDVMQMLLRLPATLEDGTPRQAILDTLARRYFPDELLLGQDNQSQSIAPTESLLYSEDSELLHQTLSSEALQATGIFEPQVVQELLKANKQAGKVSRELLLVFTTQILCKLFEVG